MFGDILQPTHLLFILVVALLVLGPKRLPEVGRSLGKALRDFRGAMAGMEEHTTAAFSDPPAAPQAEPVIAVPEAEAPIVTAVRTTPGSAVPVSVPASADPSGSGHAEPAPGDYAD